MNIRGICLEIVSLKETVTLSFRLCYLGRNINTVSIYEFRVLFA